MKLLYILLFTALCFTQSNRPLRNALIDLGKEFKKTILFNDSHIDNKRTSITWNKNDYFLEIITKIIIADSTLVLKQKNTIFLILKKKNKPLTIVVNKRNISGFIKSESGEPIEHAMVYFSNSTIGTYTDSLGSYMINGVPESSLILTVSFPGYKLFTQNIFQNKKIFNKPLTIYLKKKKPYKSSIVEIYGKYDQKWNQLYQIFLESFFGGSRFAQECTILNPEVLDFTKKKDGIVGYCKEPLVIENLALGYKIYFQLDEFNLSKLGKVHYQGTPKFEELKSIDSSQKDEWNENRKVAYKGSSTHFFKSLYAGNLENDNFFVSNTNIISKEFLTHLVSIDANKLVSPVNEKIKRLNVDGYLLINLLFAQNADFYDYSVGTIFSNDHIVQSLVYCENEIIFNKYGTVISTDFVTHGFFSFYRASGMIPINYSPKN